MPGMLMHVGATVLCTHAGQATPAVPDPRVKVSGQQIVCQSSPYTIAACPFVAGVVPMPCLTGQFISAATRVTANGQPVLLSTGQSICAPNGTPLVVVVTQTRVSGQ